MATKRAATAKTAQFMETMDCLPVSIVPEGPEWTYELKLDGYRLEAVKTRGKVTVYSRRRNILNRKFGYIADALQELPDETVLDGELVAMDEEGHADFNLLQNFKSAQSKIHYYAFDVLVHKGELLVERACGAAQDPCENTAAKRSHKPLGRRSFGESDADFRQGARARGRHRQAG
jgi:bifunctional non-homologous end joining protein LigD